MWLIDSEVSLQLGSTYLESRLVMASFRVDIGFKVCLKGGVWSVPGRELATGRLGWGSGLGRS